MEPSPGRCSSPHLLHHEAKSIRACSVHAPHVLFTPVSRQPVAVAMARSPPPHFNHPTPPTQTSSAYCWQDGGWRHAGLEELQQNSDGPDSHTQLHPSTKHTHTHTCRDTSDVALSFSPVMTQRDKMKWSQAELCLYTGADCNLIQHSQG